MFKLLFLIAWRNLLRNRLVTLINLTGLAAGITSCILIFLYVDTELSYDQHWKDNDRIYRLNEIMNFQAKDDPFALTSMRVFNELKNRFSEVEKATSLFRIPEQTVWYEGNSFSFDDNYFADSSFLEVFPFELIKGNSKTALIEPKSIVISEDVAKTIFGDVDPIGKMLQYSKNSYKVTGVIDPKANPSHFGNISALLSINSMSSNLKQNISEDYGQLSMYSYFKLRELQDPKLVEQKINEWSLKTITPWLKTHQVDGKITFSLLPISDIHFDQYYTYDISAKGNKNYILIFGSVALFLLLIACFNYMNLTTAQSVKRAREIAVKKVAGASRKQLIMQFLGESLLLTCLSFIVSLALVELLLPIFNKITGNETSLFSPLSSIRFWLALIGMLILAAVAGAGYPAFYLSKLQPIQALRAAGNSPGKKGTNWFSKSLIVVQFTISIGLIASTLLVMDQVKFLRDYNPGFDREGIMVLNYPGGDSTLVQNNSKFKSAFLKGPAILDLATADQLPGSETSRLIFRSLSSQKPSDQAINAVFADYDYQRILNIQLKQGRWFSSEFTTDMQEAFVINESCIKFLGLTNPIGAELECGLGKGKIVGVVKDYNYSSLHNSIEPIVFMLPRFNYGKVVGSKILLKINKDQAQQAIATVEKGWKELFPTHPVNYTFLDQSFDKLYEKEDIMVKVLGYFALLTILISCMGLFALSAWTTETRTKEIGIRKVLGASEKQIVTLILRDFLLMVIISFLIAVPIVWYFIREWLDGFAFRTEISWGIIFMAGFGAVLIAVATVSRHAWKAAISDPVKSLRYE